MLLDFSFCPCYAQIPYDYFEDPTVQSVVPSGGPISGGTVVTLRGKGFRTLEQEDAYLEQWAVAASSRSEYSNTAGSASRAVGVPDATGCEQERLDPNSWMPSLGTDIPDWLQVSFDRPLRPWRWQIYLSSHPEALRSVHCIPVGPSTALQGYIYDIVVPSGSITCTI